MLYFLFSSGATGITLVALVLAYVIAICFSMGAHEYAHARTAFAFGDDTAAMQGRMTLNPLAHVSGLGLVSFVLFGFGWAKPVPINPGKFRSYRKGATWVALSGVLTNLVLAFIFSALTFFVAPLLWGVDNVFCHFLGYLIEYMFLINLVLAVFNLLPVPPLDGFNLLSIWTKYGNRFVNFMSQYGMFFLILFILPIFGGSSILSLFYSHVGTVFLWFWGLFL